MLLMDYLQFDEWIHVLFSHRQCQFFQSESFYDIQLRLRTTKKLNTTLAQDFLL